MGLLRMHQGPESHLGRTRFIKSGSGNGIRRRTSESLRDQARHEGGPLGGIIRVRPHWEVILEVMAQALQQGYHTFPDLVSELLKSSREKGEQRVLVKWDGVATRASKAAFSPRLATGVAKLTATDTDHVWTTDRTLNSNAAFWASAPSVGVDEG